MNRHVAARGCTAMLVGFVLGTGAVSTAFAQSSSTGGDAGVTSAATGGASQNDRSRDTGEQGAAGAAALETVGSLREQRDALRALLKGELDVDVSPAELFPIDVSDEALVSVEKRRLTALTKLDPGDDPLFLARLEVDRAELDFYELEPNERREVLARHEQRRVEAATLQTDVERELTVTETRAREAAKERQEALAAAASAKSEAQRILNEERARLLAVRASQAEFQALIIESEGKINQLREATLTLHRKVKSHIEERSQHKVEAPVSDALYREVVKALSEARDDLARRLHEWGKERGMLARVGADKLDTLGVEVARSTYDDLRAELLTAEQALTERAESVEWKLIQARHDEMQMLNQERLELLPYVTKDLRWQVTNGPNGFHQASAEARQVALTLRYHVRSGARWLQSAKDRRYAESVFAGVTLLTLTVFVGVFLWFRRRVPRWIEAAQKSLVRHGGASSLPRLLSLYERVRGPLELLVALRIILGLMGEELSSLLEVRVLWLAAVWILGGRIAVLALDAFGERMQRRSEGVTDTSALRLRTLRLAGRFIVFFGLVLALSRELVGEGTLHGWVVTICWGLSFPIALVFVAWWRPVIFERLEPRKHRSRLAGWIIEQRAGSVSFIAAIAGSVYLFGLGTARAVRQYLSGLTSVRRLLAYLFRRELTKAGPSIDLQPLSPEHAERFDQGLEIAGDQALEVPEIAPLLAQMQVRAGGLFAIVGDRGAGKTTMLRALAEHFPASRTVTVTVNDITSFRRDVAAALAERESIPGAQQMQESGNGERLSTVLEEAGPALFLVDGAERLVRATIDGLQAFDAAIELARTRGGEAQWVFAFNRLTYQLIERVRENRPLFDEVVRLRPWDEERIRLLLRRRLSTMGLTPRFEHLVRGWIPGDEIDQAEKLERTQRGYYRLIWDYSGGNPGVALQALRLCLRQDREHTIRVGTFDAPVAEDLSGLSDPTCFVMRMLLRMEGATSEELLETTLLDASSVDSALRYAQRAGFVTLDDHGRWCVTWPWFRAMTLALERKRFISMASAG